VGWTSVPNPDEYFDFEQGWNRGTLAWDTGTAPTALFYGMDASLKLLMDTGIERIQSHLENLTDQLCDLLRENNYEVVSSRAPAEKSQIVCIRSKAGISPMALYSHLKRR